MRTDLHDHLVHLAQEAPTSVEPGRDLWRRGVRRHRRRRAATVVASAAAIVALAFAGAGSFEWMRPERPLPADTPPSELHLPRTVHAPSPWAQGTREQGPPGPLAVLSSAPRNTIDGLTGVRRSTGVFGVSAADGTGVFLDLPGYRGDEGTRLGPGAIALSPDGHKVGYIRYDDSAPRDGAAVHGWDVYDTVTGDVTRLRVPDMEEIHGMDAFEIRFSGDSRYLLTNYSPTGSDGARDDTLVAWDVSAGEPTVVEGTGHYWLPEPGSAPEGVVWSRDRRIFRFDATTGENDVVTLPREVVTASFGPDGRTLAYVGHRPTDAGQAVPWHLFGGRTAQVADRIPLGMRPSQILGWRSEHEVVVSNHRRTAWFVDVRTGEYDEVELGWDQKLAIAPPLYAADLWRNPLIEGVEPPAVPDPRWWLRPWVWGSGLMVLVAGFLFAGRRRRADG
jgi:hypothetical protein